MLSVFLFHFASISLFLPGQGAWASPGRRADDSLQTVRRGDAASTSCSEFPGVTRTVFPSIPTYPAPCSTAYRSSNDNPLDSQIVVAKRSDPTCQTCGDCSTCPGDPMCQPTCMDPPLRSCDFYASCSEATLHCGPDGYPLQYGQKNCLKFQNNVALFSPAGQDFIWSTMHCLQDALVTSTTCDSTCSTLFDAAFASHPHCYIQGGFCSLGGLDILHVITTVGLDLFKGPAFMQVLQTAQGCVGQILANLEAEVKVLAQKATSDVDHAALRAAKTAKAFFQGFLEVSSQK